MLILKKLHENYPQQPWTLAPGFLEFRKITINLPRIGRSQDHTNAWLLDRSPAFKLREKERLYMILPSFDRTEIFLRRPDNPVGTVNTTHPERPMSCGSIHCMARHFFLLHIAQTRHRAHPTSYSKNPRCPFPGEYKGLYLTSKTKLSEIVPTVSHTPSWQRFFFNKIMLGTIVSDMFFWMWNECLSDIYKGRVKILLYLCNQFLPNLQLYRACW